ncbi:ephrin-A1-like [Chiloscyllium plagiosum]|uniref:ephrin-A1-like n=1 Tax=Chiloscyllium plagiosum TaxID=36176 RepID=UPI001CB85526|nr:ephrin-A1-like [Chiloscyllium plagiosum]
MNSECPLAWEHDTKHSSLRLQQPDFTIELRPNDYLDINCPHYQEPMARSTSVERYTLYLVNREDYDSCEPKSKDQVRWECKKPHAIHGPERFSEKFQRYTPFSLGKEFKPGHYYYYVSKPVHHHGEQCLRVKVYVCCKRDTDVRLRSHATQPSLPADEPGVDLPSIQRSTGSSGALVASRGLTLLLTLGILLL